MSKSPKKPKDDKKAKGKQSPDANNDELHFNLDDDEQEEISEEQKYWERYFEDDDPDLRHRKPKKFKEKGKYKDRDSE
ncbi:hypothetical protein GWO43_02515 [candidate division KSB1 bacterium]|nr:hypothetical protein [candidate division KSB1 bacterium]NIR69739.1 hypothetical protein [candidate division KSB1 bacterium]NIS22927.1 hypothetical protein [candidate division KSB1 bacterium]NIT69784.1 hypothetical protein [candidate division KSB1 bacterium]NIU23458.1 hypothetical protein [candidate division KSB1 bacterium]